MIQKKFLAASAVATLALSLAACSAPETSDNPSSGGSSDSSGGGQTTGGDVNIGWNQPFYSYNDNTSDGNASANAVILYMMKSGFNYYDDNLELVRDEDFGTYEKTSDDPLTVKYTINENSKWSDGTPVDAADMLLEWAAGSGNVNTKKSVEGKGGVYFDTSSAGLPLVKETPEISDDGKSMTLVYTEPFADWELQIAGGDIPAHVVAAQALGIEDPTEGKQAIIDAITNKNNADLAKIADFWNDGFDFTQLPEDKSLYLSSGPYLLTKMEENQFATLEKNPDYKGSLEGNLDSITVRWNEDPNSQLQQLQNGEIDAFAPQVTSDLIQAAEGDQDIKIQTGEEAVYEHFDLTFDNGGPFDPKTYGGDEEKALKVRQAFVAAYPRQEIVSKLIQPVDDQAQVRDSYLITPGAPGYDQMVQENGTAQYAEADPELAKQLLKEAGVKTPIKVKMMYAADNVRRAQEFQLVQPALKEVGFDLIDGQSPKWGEKLGDGTYDAVFFGWASTSTAVTESTETYRTGGLNNLNGYSNETVDEAFNKLGTTTDAQEQLDLQIQIEKELVNDAYGLTIFQFPGAAFSNTQRISGINSIALSPTLFYGFWDWSVPSN